MLDLWFVNESDAEAACESDPGGLLPTGTTVALSVVGHDRLVMRMPDFYDTPTIKGVYLFRGKPGMPLADFRQYWWQNHGPIAARTEEALCYAQSHLTTTDKYHGITEIYWPSLEAAFRGIGSEQMRNDQANDAKQFVEDGSVSLFLANQQIVIAP